MKYILAFIFTAICLTGAAFGQTSSFNYQGKLTETGAAANGSYQFQFKLYDAAVGGAQIGATLSDVAVTVTDGTFVANLDFGAAAYTGADRYLDVSVRKTAGDPYTPLTPRQKLNSAPYASRAAKAGDADAVGGQSAVTISSAVQTVTNATPANTANTLVKRDANGQIIIGSLKFGDGTSMTTAAVGGSSVSLSSPNNWTAMNTFSAGISVSGTSISNVGNPIGGGDATNKAYVDANTVRFGPGAQQLSVGDANGTATMVNLRGQSTCCGANTGFADFKVFQNGSFVASGNLGIGTSPMEGHGYRTSWHTYKGAFRSGYADNEWDDANTGFFSWAGGSNSTASGLYALAFGDTNFAESTSSIVFGSGNQVKGAAGFSAGAGNRVCDTYGVALGNNAKSGGPYINGKCDPETFNIRGLAAVAIGYYVTADQDHTTAMGKFASNNGFQGTFIWADGSAQASADTFRNTANNEFAARATGGFRFRTNLAGTTGCVLPGGSGVMSCTSSRYTKENFASANGVLASLRKVPVSTWNYISEGKQVRHLGPMAEDFFSQFRLGTGNTAIGVQDLAGVSIAAVKELDEQLQQKNAEVERLQNEVKSLRSNQAELEKRLLAIEQAIVKQQ
ncbi:MAG TPA: tail fiber domain-containing protein [Pyrinomonadaceae bacterium]|nr:tail fiber domain-containing protein [Pyrinomonadaceae bacterium]